MSASHSYAIFSARYAPLTGGVESFTQRLSQKLVERGDHVVVVTSRIGDEPAHETQADGVEVLRLPARTPFGARMPVSRKNAEYKRMMDELAHLGIDRVLVNTRFYRHSLEGVRFAQRIGAPVIVLDHGSAHLTMGNRALDWFVERYEHAVTKRIRALRPMFAGISQASIAWLAHFGIEADAVICNAIDVDEYRSCASDRDFSVESKPMPERKLVAFVGRLEPEKGALEFAQAAALLGNEFACVMAGDGSLHQRIRDLHGSDVTLLGRLSQSTLSALLRDSDIFCLPTRSEGFCTSLLEASAQAVIPVMPHVGGTDEVMGWDPVRYGVGLDACDAQSIAQGIRVAAALPAEQAALLQEHVREACSWDETCESLDAAFERSG